MDNYTSVSFPVQKFSFAWCNLFIFIWQWIKWTHGQLIWLFICYHSHEWSHDNTAARTGQSSHMTQSKDEKAPWFLSIYGHLNRQHELCQWRGYLATNIHPFLHLLSRVMFRKLSKTFMMSTTEVRTSVTSVLDTAMHKMEPCQHIIGCKIQNTDSAVLVLSNRVQVWIQSSSWASCVVVLVLILAVWIDVLVDAFLACDAWRTVLVAETLKM